MTAKDNREGVKAAWITAGGTIIAALIVALGAAQLGPCKPLNNTSTPPVAEGSRPSRSQDDALPKLALGEPVPIPQPVNRKGVGDPDSEIPNELAETELSTLNFELSNRGEDGARVERASVIVDEVKSFRGGVATALFTHAIDHEGHIEVWLRNPEVGDTFEIPFDFDVPPDGKRVFGIWFKSTDAPRGGVLLLKARLRIENGEETVTSPSFRIAIHSDSAEMHYGTESVDGN